MLEAIDIGLARGIVLVLLIIAFLGIWAWAWRRKRQPEFHAASMLPLEEDDGRVPPGQTLDDADSDDKTQAGTKE